MTQEEYDRLSAIITDLQYFAIESKPQDKYEQLKRLKPPFLVINEYTTDEERRLHKIRSQEYLRQLNQILKGGTQKKVTGEQKQQAYFTKKELESMPTLKDCHIRQKPNGTYEIRYRRLGFEKSFSSKILKEAKARCYEWLATLNVDLKSHVLKPQEKKFTRFIDFANNYIYKIKKKRVKESTFQSYRLNYENNIVPIYGNMRLCDISPFFIQHHLDELNVRTPRACEDVKMLLNNIFDYAVANGILERNPIKAVYIPKHQRKNGQALTPTQEKQFVQNIKGSKYENYFLKMLYSGVRPSEVFEITEDVNKNVLIIKNSKLKSYQKEKYRTIPIFPKYKETLSMPITETASLEQLRLEFKKFCPNNTLKDLRHTFTTRARECGIENELVAVWTGHSLGNITSSVYTHFSNEHQQKEAKKLVY